MLSQHLIIKVMQTPKKAMLLVEKNQKNIDIIFKMKSGKVLYGNPCLREFTRDMGFEYALQDENKSELIKSGYEFEWE